MIQNKINLSTYNELFIIDLDAVLFFQADDHYTNVVYSSGAHFMVPFGLSKIEAMISDVQHEKKFLVRLGRKYIINTKRIFHINTVKQIIVLTDNHGTNVTIQFPKHILRELIENISK